MLPPRWAGYAGAYGIGGVVSPLFATVMMSRGVRWSWFYTIMLALSVANLVFPGWVFNNFQQNDITPSQQTETHSTNPSNDDDNSRTTQGSILSMAIKNRTTLLGSLFIFAYQGAEVSISGWVVSFLIAYRKSDPSHLGYVSAGFWAGITLGRFLLVYPSHQYGEKIAVNLMAVGAIAFQLMAWFIPNTVGDAVSVAILGVVLDAVYPCSMAVFVKLLPGKIQIADLSFIGAVGSSGGAFFPFLTGLLAQNVGTMVLHPICIGLYGAMVTSWLCLPRILILEEL
ncbi:hypothetical protein EYB25_000822 [Talaromyces marneffei]|nr:hypothetical protein EYB25_000822 [Talaromyces marneffei]